METAIINEDIKVFYVTATYFPAGIMDAHQKLHNLIPFSLARKYFGISRPENGEVVYRAAATELEPGEGEKLGCETLVLKSGQYLSTTIHDYISDIPAIGCAFKDILAQPGIDPHGYCVEWYISDKEVRCMVRLG